MRIITLILCLVLALSMTACGGAAKEAPAASAAPAETETPAETEPPAAEDAGAAPAYDEAAYAAAQSCVGRTAEELIAAIGEPEDTQYAPSCLVEDGEDGMLYYDGFYVWTVKTDTEELVHEVYLNE